MFRKTYIFRVEKTEKSPEVLFSYHRHTYLDIYCFKQLRRNEFYMKIHRTMIILDGNFENFKTFGQIVFKLGIWA